MPEQPKRKIDLTIGWELDERPHLPPGTRKWYLELDGQRIPLDLDEVRTMVDCHLAAGWADTAQRIWTERAGNTRAQPRPQQ